MPTDSAEGQVPKPQESNAVSSPEQAPTPEVPLHSLNQEVINMTNGAPAENPYVQKLTPQDLTPIGSNTPLDVERINAAYTPPAIPNENSYPKPLDLTESGNAQASTPPITEQAAPPLQTDSPEWRYQPKTVFTSQAVPMPVQQPEQPIREPQAYKPERPKSLGNRLVTNHGAALIGTAMLAAVGTTLDQNGESNKAVASSIKEPEIVAPASKSFWEHLGLDKLNIFAGKKAEPMQQMTQQTQAELANTQSADLVSQTAAAARTETLTAEGIAEAAKNSVISTSKVETTLPNQAPQSMSPIAQEQLSSQSTQLQPDSIVASQPQAEAQPTTIFNNTTPNTFGGK